MSNIESLSSEQLGWIYIAYNEFRYNGRPLGRAEISKLTAMMLGSETIHRNGLIALLKIFDDPEDVETIRAREKTRGNEEYFLADVEKKFATYRREDEGAEDECINLKGL